MDNVVKLYEEIDKNPFYLAIRAEIRSKHIQKVRLQQEIVALDKQAERMLQPLLEACVKIAENNGLPCCPEVYKNMAYCDDCPCFDQCPSIKKTFTD